MKPIQQPPTKPCTAPPTPLLIHKRMTPLANGAVSSYRLDNIPHVPTAEMPMPTHSCSTCNMPRRQNSCDDDLLFLHPGPVDLLYGAEIVRTEVVARHLSFVRRRRKRINHLSLLGSELADPKGLFKYLGKKLKKFNVRELAINGITSMGNEELTSFAPFLNSNKTLKILDLSGARFDAKALQEMRCFFMKNPSLEVLVLKDNEYVGDKGAAVVSSLQEGRMALRLRTLSMKGCGLGSLGVASISNLLNSCPLQRLELSSNMIGDAGVEILAESINNHNCQLEFVGLNSVGVRDRGALLLADAMKTNRSITSLSLQNNGGITSFGAAHLLKTIYNTNSLQSLLKSNHVLNNLNIAGCTYVGESLLKIAEELLSTQGLAKHQIIRFKVAKYAETTRNGIILEGFDAKLLPHILSFVGHTNGLSFLFESIRNMPSLYTQFELSPNSCDFRFDDFLKSLKAQKRARCWFHEGFETQLPKPRLRSILRHHDGRHVNKHEVPMRSLSRNTKCKDPLSLDIHSTNACNKNFPIHYMSPLSSLASNLKNFLGEYTDRRTPTHYLRVAICRQ